VLLLPFDYGDQGQQGFVFTVFVHKTGIDRHVLFRAIHDPDTKTVVAVAPNQKRSDGSPIFYGWASANAGRLIYAHVDGDLVAFHLAPRMVKAVGVDTESPFAVLFPTAAIERMARAYGWKTVTAGA
jgi:hypothetical protein